MPTLGSFNYDSANFTPTAPGTYRWVARYSGDANNPPVGPTACADPAEAVTVAATTPMLTTTASTGVTVGRQVHDAATLTGNTSYGSGNFTPTTAGTYRWVASYSGDANNNPVITSCTDAAASVLVRALAPTPTPPTTPTTTTPPTTTPPTGGGGLADTGRPTQSLFAAGLWAVVLGWLLVLAGTPLPRRRRSRAY